MRLPTLLLKKTSHLCVALLLFSACSNRVEIPGLDMEKWKSAPPCSELRVSGAEAIQANEEALLGVLQRDLDRVLGTAPRHELGRRSEKFFYYPISKQCDSIPDQSLQIRFDALARVKEVMIVLD